MINNRTLYFIAALSVSMLCTSVWVGASYAIKGHYYESQYDHFVKAMEADPEPHWLKEIEDSTPPKIEMLYLNPAYTKEFGITLEEYIGKQDVEMWGHEIGMGFYQEDLSVFNSGNSFCDYKEFVSDNGIDYKRRVCKWLIRTGGDSYILSGRSSRVE